MSDVKSGVPESVTARQFNRQMAIDGLSGIFPNRPVIIRENAADRDEYLSKVYGLTASDIDQLFINAAKL